MTQSSFNEVGGREAEKDNVPFESAQPRILIVDGDHPSVLAVYDMAKSFNLRIDAANGGEAALNCLNNSSYDAVIADLEIRDLSGYELARRIRDKSPETRVIIMTGRNHAETERYRNSGIVDHWIYKPFGINDLGIVLDDLALDGLTDSTGTG